MKKIRFIFKRLRNFNFSAMFKTASIVSKKTHRLYVFVLIDIVYCGLKYQAGYNDYLEFEFYLLNNKQRKTYLTAGKNNEIVRKYNNKEYWHLLDNKIEFNKIFDKYLKREWLDLTKATVDNFKDFVSKHDVIIVKPIDDCGGNGVKKTDTKEYKSLEDLYNMLKSNKQFLVEEYIIQHEEMSRLSPSSVNTLRMFTINLNGKVNVLQAVLKIGNGGDVDNFSSGGMYTFVDDNGVVIAPAIDKEDNIYKRHPLTNEKIIGFKTPLYKQAKELVCEAAKEISQIGYIGWDIAITKNGPVVLEGNVFPGVFQIRPSFSREKIGILPTYLKYMDI